MLLKKDSKKDTNFISNKVVVIAALTLPTPVNAITTDLPESSPVKKRTPFTRCSSLFLRESSNNWISALNAPTIAVIVLVFWEKTFGLKKQTKMSVLMNTVRIDAQKDDFGLKLNMFVVIGGNAFYSWLLAFSNTKLITRA
mgnify:CR=1 FL=1